MRGKYEVLLTVIGSVEKTATALLPPQLRVGAPTQGTLHFALAIVDGRGTPVAPLLAREFPQKPMRNKYHRHGHAQCRTYKWNLQKKCVNNSNCFNFNLNIPIEETSKGKTGADRPLAEDSGHTNWIRYIGPSDDR